MFQRSKSVLEVKLKVEIGCQDAEQVSEVASECMKKSGKV